MPTSKKKSKGRAPRHAHATKTPAARRNVRSKPAEHGKNKPAAAAAKATSRAENPKPASGRGVAAPPPPALPAPPRTAPHKGSSHSKKPSRRGGLGIRRGPGGELLMPGDILLPGGPQSPEEVQYLFRGCVAAEHAAGDAGVAEILAKRTSADPEAERAELTRHLGAMVQRFGGGTIEPLLPPRPQATRRTFQTVVERAKLRRREIGSFLRGLDLGRTETSHMDSHGEASLQALMEWAARLENLAEADEPEQADYAQFHRGLDQLENTTEALIVDVEATLRRLRDRVRPA